MQAIINKPSRMRFSISFFLHTTSLPGDRPILVFHDDTRFDMSQPTQPKPDHPETPAVDTPAAETKAPVVPAYKTYAKDCALLFPDALGAIVTSGGALGVPSKITSRFVSFTSADTMPWIGLQLNFPLGDEQRENEDFGFGVRHSCELSCYMLPANGRVANAHFFL